MIKALTFLGLMLSLLTPRALSLVSTDVLSLRFFLVAAYVVVWRRSFMMRFRVQNYLFYLILGILYFILNELSSYTYQYEVFFVAMIAQIFVWTRESYAALIVFIVINLFAKFYEFIQNDYLFWSESSTFFHPGRLQGLFAYSKEAGYFYATLPLFYLIRRRGALILLLAIFGSMATGTRTALLSVMLVVLVHVFRDGIKIRLFSILLVSLFIASSMFELNRYYGMFDINSSSNSERFYFMYEHIDKLSNSFNIYDYIFGTGTYVSIEVGNGSENLFIFLFESFGIVSIFLLIYIWLFTKYRAVLIPLFFCGLVGRYGVGLADGLIVFSLLNYDSLFISKSFKKGETSIA